MASILIVSKQGDGVSLALRLASEGHIVKMWFKDQRFKPCLDGFRNPSKISDPLKMTEQYDLVISDMVGNGSICDTLSERGKLVISGGSFNDKLELDREYGSKVAKTLTETKSPRTQDATTKQQLIDLLDSEKAACTVKPLGNRHTGLTLVSKDPSNRMLKSIMATRAEEYLPCIVQETISGIEVSTEGWFNGRAWVKPFNHTFEQKRLTEGDRGPHTGCMGNVVWATDGDKLTKAAIEPLAPLLQKVNYIGPIDMNCIVTDSEAYFLEFSARLGYDAFQAWSELVKSSVFDYLYNIASAQKESFDYHTGYAMAVRLVVSPHPTLAKMDKWHSVKVIDPPKEAMRHIWMADVMKKDDDLQIAGTDGVVCCVTSRGTSVRECQRRTYRTIRNIVLTDEIQYRSDIGNNVEDDKQRLVEMGWLNA